jgi:hypothetical protein
MFDWVFQAARELNFIFGGCCDVYVTSFFLFVWSVVLTCLRMVLVAWSVRKKQAV